MPDGHRMATLDGQTVELEAWPDGPFYLTPCLSDDGLPRAYRVGKLEGIRTIRYRLVPEFPAGLELVDASLAMPPTFGRVVP